MANQKRVKTTNDPTANSTWAEWYLKNFVYKSYFDKKSGLNKPQYVSIDLHVFGTLTFLLPVRQRVLFYLLYRWGLGKKPFLKPDYGELAGHLRCDKSAIYKAMNFWIGKGGFLAEKRNNGLTYLTLNGDPDIWLSILPDGKEILQHGKFFLQPGKNICQCGKNEVAENSVIPNENRAFRFSLENPKDSFKEYINDDDKKENQSSSFLWGGEEKKKEEKDLFSHSPEDAHAAISKKDIPYVPSAMSREAAQPATAPSHEATPAPAIASDRQADTASAAQSPRDTCELIRETLMARHRKHYPDYKSNSKDHHGFRKTARMLMALPEEDLFFFKDEAGGTDWTGLAKRYTKFIAEQWEESGWTPPHGGNYCSADNIEEFRRRVIGKFRRSREQERIEREMPPPEVTPPEELQKREEQRVRDIRERFENWKKALTEGEMECLGGQAMKIKGRIGDDAVFKMICELCPLRYIYDYQWMKCSYNMTGNDFPKDLALERFSPEIASRLNLEYDKQVAERKRVEADRAKYRKEWEGRN